MYSKRKAYYVHHHIAIMNVHHVSSEQKQQIILKFKRDAFLTMQIVYHQILFFNLYNFDLQKVFIALKSMYSSRKKVSIVTKIHNIGQKIINIIFLLNHIFIN